MKPSNDNAAVADLLSQAEAFQRSGDLEGALGRYRQVLELRPHHGGALQGAGIVCGQRGRFGEARDLFAAACAAQPDNAAAHFNHGTALQALADLPAALLSYRRAIALKPDFAEAFNNRGNVLSALSRHGEALASFDRAIALWPGFLGAMVNRNVVLMALDRHDEALAAYRRLLSLQADIPELWNNAGNALKALERMDEAVVHYRRAVALRPDYPDAWHNIAIMHNALGRLDQAAAVYERTLALKPGDAEVRFDLGLLRLLQGDFARGWPLHEWRRQARGRWQAAPSIQRPLWLGEAPVAGRTILLRSEQGMGDVIQFVRYAPLVAAQGAKVLLAAPPALGTLLRSLRAEVTLIDGGGALPPFDLQCPLMSLPLAFGTRVDTVPAPIPYLGAEPARRQLWRQRLGPRRRPRIGLVWSGNPRHRNDRQRSMPLAALAPLLALNCEFHALYKVIREEDRAVITQWPHLLTHEHELGDFADTAALIAELDRVIAVDTAVAHLAGAMGAPLWVLLPFVPDFRWLTGRSDSPWYPTARLFRQHRRGEWRGVVAEVCEALRAGDPTI